MQLATVVYMPSVSDSLSYRFYEEPIKKHALLDWLLDWLVTCKLDANPYLLCHCGSEGKRLAEYARRHGVSIFFSPYRTQLRSIVAFHEAVKCDHLCTIPIGAPLGPPDIVQRTWQHHLASSNDYTEVTGLPRDITPSLYSQALISSAAEFDLPSFPSDLQPLIQTILTTREAVGELPIQLKAKPFDAIKEYGIAPEQLPPAIDLTEPKIISIVRAILDELPSSQKNGSIDYLACYKKRLLEDRHRQYKELQNKLAGTVLASSERRISERIKVLFISQCSAYSGAEDSFCRLISAIDPERYDKYALVALEGLFAQRLREAGAKVICPNTAFGPTSAYNILYLMNIYREVQPCIVHHNDFIGSTASICSTMMNVPLVQHVRVNGVLKMGDTSAIAKGFIAVSKFVRSELAKMNIDQERLHVVYDGIDVDRFHRNVFDPISVREELGIPQEYKVILLIARLAKYKRHDLFLEAVAMIRKSIPLLRILLVGESFQQEARIADQVKRLIEQYRLEDVISFLPFQEDIRKVELAADIQVLCSDGDPLGTCILESMALEVPVVVTNSGGLREIVEDGVSGFVVPSGDTQSLAEKMLRLLCDDDLRRRMGKAARERILACATSEICARNVTDIYEAVLGESRAGRV